jgi:protein SCO1/2
LSSALGHLTEQEKNNFQSIFISVDPGRDTPDKLLEYVKYFDPNMIGLSAAPNDLDPVVAQYGAFYEKIPFSNSSLMYGIDHTSETYIVGKDGKLFAILPHATASAKILKTLREAMKFKE